jgi:RiboL-PSP-HEPN
MPASDVERIHKEFTDLVQLLSDRSELSLQTSADDSFRKVLLLSAASYFEHELTTIIAAFVAEVTSSDGLIMALVQNKAISRQYHTWFNWNDKNANQFFGLFGEDFKIHMTALVKSSPELDNSIKAFLEIGQQRNRLVHQNFASFGLEKTSDEIFTLYRDAVPFIETVSRELRECSKKLNPSKRAPGTDVL